MPKYNCDKPCPTWCIRFDASNCPSLAFSGQDGNHYIVDRLKSIFKMINENSSKACLIPTDKIIVT